MATQYFSFDELAGSDPAGYTSINDLMDSIDSTLNTRFGSILNNTNYPPVGATDKVLFWDGSAFGLQKIDNDNVASGASIAYSKLNLTNSIVSADIVDGTIVNADINASAAIAYSKLALSSSIQTGDFAAGATAPKATDLTGSTVGLVYQQGTDDTTAIANGTNGQILQLTGGAPVWSNVSGLSIDTANIADDAITDAKLRDSISTDSDRAVTTNHIRDNAVTNDKLASAVQAFLVPSGTVFPYAGSSEPTGYLFCHGQSVSTSTYATLFSAIGYTYGGSGGSFNLPDLRGRVVAGRDNMGGSDAGRLSLANNLGTAGGSETVTLGVSNLPAHNHSVSASGTGSGSTNNDGSHSHNMEFRGFGSASGGGTLDVLISKDDTTGNQAYNYGPANVGSGMRYAGAHDHGVNVTTNVSGNATTIGSWTSQTATDVTQPTIILNYIIKV